MPMQAASSIFVRTAPPSSLYSGCRVAWPMMSHIAISTPLAR